jgi:hypothetical protein
MGSSKKINNMLQTASSTRNRITPLNAIKGEVGRLTRLGISIEPHLLGQFDRLIAAKGTGTAPRLSASSGTPRVCAQAETLDWQYPVTAEHWSSWGRYAAGAGGPGRLPRNERWPDVACTSSASATAPGGRAAGSPGDTGGGAHCRQSLAQFSMLRLTQPGLRSRGGTGLQTRA